jgi:nitrogen fixation/metabolism regulation signal transduction histidine kinase
MISKNFYFQVIFRVVLLVITITVMTIFFMKLFYVWSVILFLILFIQVVSLIKHINATNRKMAYFFNAVKNEDFTLRFSEENKEGSYRELHRILNKLNDKIKEVYIKNQIQEKYYQEIIKQADIGILIINQNGHILIANPKVEKLLNYEPLNHIKQLKYVDSELYKTIAKLESIDRKLIQIVSEREKKQLSLKSTSILLNNQKQLLVTIQDIHKELENKETDSWTKLIRVMSHEIMNTITPVTSISNSILNYYKHGEMILHISELKDEQIQNTVKGLEVINEQSESLMDFVKSYRSFLNIPKPNKKIVLAKELIDKILIMMVESDINFSVKVDPVDLEFYIDEVQLKLVLINLIKNAIQSLKDQKEKLIEINAGISKNRKFIGVKDNGPGIPSELIDEIFIPFFTTKTNGSGIGLSLSKQIARLHGGSLVVHSKINEETSFIVNLD